MNAVLADPDRYMTFSRTDLTEDEKLRRVTVSARLINRFRLARRHCASFRCTVCGGRVDVEARHDRKGAIVGSVGSCRTRNCIAWEE